MPASRSCAPATARSSDPDELARNDLPRLQALIDDAQDAVEFFFEQVAATSAPTVPGRVAAIEECVPLLRALRDPLARDLYCDKLAQLLKVDAGLVQRALRGGTGAAAAARAHADARRRQRPSRSRRAGRRSGESPLTHAQAAGLLGAARRHFSAARERRSAGGNRRRGGAQRCSPRRMQRGSFDAPALLDALRCRDPRRRGRGARAPTSSPRDDETAKPHLSTTIVDRAAPARRDLPCARCRSASRARSQRGDRRT